MKKHVESKIDPIEELQKFADRNVKEGLFTPRYPQRIVLRATGISQARLQNWINREPPPIELSFHGQERELHQRRLYTLADIIRLATAFELTRNNVPVKNAAKLSELVLGRAEQMFRVCGTPPNMFFVVAQDGTEIDVFGPYFENSPVKFMGDDFPKISLQIHPDRIIKDVMIAAGIQFVSGTAADFRKAAETMDGKNK